MRGLFGLLATLLIAGVAGVIGYNWGYGNGLAAGAAASGASVIYTPGYGFGWGGGFGFFGLFFGLLIIFLIFGAIRRAAWGWGGRGWGGWGHGYARDYGYGPGYGKTGGNVPPMVDGMLGDWHKRAHGDQPAGSGNDPNASPPKAS